MELKTHTYIESVISRKKPSEIVFPADFRGKGSQAAIKKAMSRLVSSGRLKRLGHGIYYIPKSDAVLGELRPDPDRVIELLARKEHIRIRPAGAFALHRLGLTTQVPMKRVYITDGHSKHFRLGNIQVKFKATTAKKLATKGKISSLAIQAIEEIGVDRINLELQGKIREFLLKEKQKNLEHDLALAPAKISDFIFKLIKTKTPKEDD